VSFCQKSNRKISPLVTARSGLMVNRNWRYLLFLLASHHPKEKLDHTIHVGLGRKHVYLCSRCTGIALGMATVFGFNAFSLTVPMELFLPLIGLLPAIAVADWFTQSAKLRQSNTGLRVGSGFLLGISEALGLLLLVKGLFLSFLVAVGMAAIYAVTVYLIAAKTKCLQPYLEEMNRVGVNQKLP
jgi:uncharacterized membrane protein